MLFCGPHIFHLITWHHLLYSQNHIVSLCISNPNRPCPFLGQVLNLCLFGLYNFLSFFFFLSFVFLVFVVAEESQADNRSDLKLDMCEPVIEAGSIVGQGEWWK